MGLYIALLVLVVPIVVQESPQFTPGFVQLGAFKVSIANEGEGIPDPTTSYENLGPMVGNILNRHYFPGLKFYEAARYRDAYDQLTFVIDRPYALDGNPNQALYLTSAHYMRGMAFRYHASGPGRLTLAKQDFEMAIRYSDKNYPAYLELAKVFSSLSLNEQAAVILRHLIGLKPDKEIFEQASSYLKSLGVKSK